MRRMVSFCLVLLTLLALATPSLAAISLAPAVVHANAVTVSVDTGVTAPAFKPCQLKGGERVLPCNPDRAVLLEAILAPQVAPVAPRALFDERRPPSLAPALDPPPPRHP